MKKTLSTFFLIIFSNSFFGQANLSKDVIYYLKNETKINEKSSEIVEDILKKSHTDLFIDWNKFVLIPTFRMKEDRRIDNLDEFMLALRIDEAILWNEILIVNQPNKNFKSFDGITFCELGSCKVYLYSDSPERHKRYEKATEKFIFSDNYDLIFKIEDYPSFWFMWKNKRLSLYSFLNETLYTDKSELHSYLKNYIMKNKH